MKEGKVKFGNKGLVILLCVLGVVIVGLGVGVGVLSFNTIDQVANTDDDKEKEDIINGYNEALTKAKNDNEKNDIYINKAFDLKELMFETGKDYCGEIIDSLSSVKEEELSEGSVVLMGSIISICKEDIVYGDSSAEVVSND